MFKGGKLIKSLVLDWRPVLYIKSEMKGCRGRSRFSGKGVHMFRGVGVGFADFISFFLNIP